MNNKSRGQLGISFWIRLILYGGIVCLMIVLGIYNGRQEIQLLQNNGVLTVGVIVGYKRVKGVKVLVSSFKVNGKTYYKQIQYFDNARNGDLLNIVYYKQDPEINMVVEDFFPSKTDSVIEGSVLFYDSKIPGSDILRYRYSFFDSTYFKIHMSEFIPDYQEGEKIKVAISKKDPKVSYVIVRDL